LAGCSLLPHRLSPELQQAATEQGRAGARLHLPPLPDRCRKPVAHAAVPLGESIGAILKREQAKLDVANDDKGRCALMFYDPLRARLAGSK